MTCYGPKLTVCTGKLVLSQKHLKSGCWRPNRLYQVDFWPPWKLWGKTVQTNNWEGRWHQNCGYKSPKLFFGYEQGNLWKTKLFSQIVLYPKIYHWYHRSWSRMFGAVGIGRIFGLYLILSCCPGSPYGCYRRVLFMKLYFSLHRPIIVIELTFF